MSNTKLLLSLSVLCLSTSFAPLSSAQDIEDLLEDDQISAQSGVELTIGQVPLSPFEADDMVVSENAPLPNDEMLIPADQLPAANMTAETDSTPSVPHSGMYFDSDAIGPDPTLGGAEGPREVDPKYEPGARYVVVKKAANAGSMQSKIVAADRALKLGRYSSALSIYEDLYTSMPKNRTVLMGLAVAQQKNGLYESAIATYEELLKTDPNNIDATVNMMAIIAERYPSVAYRKLKDLWDGDHKSPMIAAQLGLASAQAGNIQEAVTYLGIAASMEPNNPQHFMNLAVISDRAGAMNDAIEMYERALEVDAASGRMGTVPREQIYDRLAKLRRL